MSKEQNSAQIVAACGQRLEALNTHVTAKKTTIPINGQPMKLSDLVESYQACIDTRAALIKQRAAFNTALVARDGAEKTRQAIDAGLKTWVASTYGPKSQVAEEFGFLPTTPRAKSAATKATAVEKLLATRAARGTKGKRQREQIKGTIVAPAAPADPAVTTQAAAPAASVTASTNGAPTSAPSPNGVAGSH